MEGIKRNEGFDVRMSECQNVDHDESGRGARGFWMPPKRHARRGVCSRADWPALLAHY